MLYQSPVYSDARGSLAGLTYSRNRGGLYVRARAVPTNPGTDQQQAVRSWLGQLVGLWLSTLDAVQRAAWESYAAQVTVPNKLGDQIHLSGQQHYIRSNVPRLQAGLTRVDDGPTVYDLGDFTQPEVCVNATTDIAYVTFTGTDDWVDEDGAAMLVYLSRDLAPTINYHRGPYRFADSIDGDSVSAPSTPAAVACPFNMTEGNHAFARVRVTRADGRLSLEDFQGPILIEGESCSAP